MRELIPVFRSNYKQFTTIFVVLIIGGQAFSLVGNLDQGDHVWDYYYFMAPYLWTCDPLEVPQRNDNITRNPLSWWLKCTSHNLFGNYKLLVVPFGIAIMPLTYMIATRLTGDRLIGLLSLIALVFNPVYTDWAAHGTYDQVWAFFLLLSFYFMIGKQNTRSLTGFLVSIVAKSHAILYTPVWLYMIRKDRSTVLLVILIFAAVGLYLVGTDSVRTFVGNGIGFFPERWEDAVFRNISLFWQIIPALLLFVGINRYFVPSNRPRGQKIIALWMMWVFCMSPLVYFFTLQDTYTYRFVPLAVFMSIFIGQTIVQVGNWVSEKVINKPSIVKNR